MRIATILKYNPFFTQGAAANRWQGLFLGLLEQGVEIDIFCHGGYSSATEKKEKGNPGLRGLQVRYLTNMVFDSLNKRRFNEYVLKPIATGMLERMVLRAFKEKSYDFLWMDHESEYYQLSLSLKAKFPTTKLFSELSEFLDIHHYNTDNSLQKQRADRRQLVFEEQLLPNLDGIAYMTKALMNHYKALSPSGLASIHLPMTVDLTRFENKDTVDYSQPYIAFLGVMNNQKDGLDVLIQSFSLIAPDFPDFILRLFGFDHPDVAGQQRLIEQLGLEKRIIYHGPVDRNHAVGVMMNASLLVLPRPDSHQAKGGFPTKLGEYLATGNPVCATRVGEIPDYLEDGVSVFFSEPSSIEDFALAMRRALSNPEMAKMVGEKGKAVAKEHFNSKIQSVRLYQFLKDLKDA